MTRDKGQRKKKKKSGLKSRKRRKVNGPPPSRRLTCGEIVSKNSQAVGMPISAKSNNKPLAILNPLLM
jgi:hypothetical protein